jgi:hypothetical protein
MNTSDRQDALAMLPHEDSIVRAPDGRQVPVKVHRCVWNGAYPENSLPAIAECFREGGGGASGDRPADACRC